MRPTSEPTSDRASQVLSFVTAFLIGFVMFLAGATLGHAQDTTAVIDPAASNMTLLGGWLALKALGVPLIASWLFKQWNLARAKTDAKGGFATAALYVGFAVVLGLIATAAGTVIGNDPTTWTVGTAATLVGAIIHALAVKTGIETSEAKAAKFGRR